MKKLFLIMLIFTLVSQAINLSAGQSDGGQKVIVYYFHGSARCPTCHKLENYSRQAVETNFKDALEKGKLEFKIINVDEKINEHFVNDYGLYTKSLILSLVQNDKEVKSKNLDKIWEYVGNKDRFIDYVKNGVADFLKEAK